MSLGKSGGTWKRVYYRPVGSDEHAALMAACECEGCGEVVEEPYPPLEHTCEPIAPRPRVAIPAPHAIRRPFAGAPVRVG